MWQNRGIHTLLALQLGEILASRPLADLQAARDQEFKELLAINRRGENHLGESSPPHHPGIGTAEDFVSRDLLAVVVRRDPLERDFPGVLVRDFEAATVNSCRFYSLRFEPRLIRPIAPTHRILGAKHEHVVQVLSQGLDPVSKGPDVLCICAPPVVTMLMGVLGEVPLIDGCPLIVGLQQLEEDLVPLDRRSVVVRHPPLQLDRADRRELAE
mmetsp:Transcript_84437/g.237388  ORF Transcript_84437/g.237388 Transcript_84437/m.237388 type:complete len:213 (+) Transcript_84437:818-1456(+)